MQSEDWRVDGAADAPNLFLVVVSVNDSETIGDSVHAVALVIFFAFVFFFVSVFVQLAVSAVINLVLSAERDASASRRIHSHMQSCAYASK